MRMKYTRTWHAFISELRHNGILDLDEVFVDASFFPAKRGRRSRENQAGKGIEVLGMMARGFLSEAIPTVPRHLRSRSLIRLLKKSESPNEGREDHGPDRKE